MSGAYLDGEPPICEGCSKPVLRGQFCHAYDDVGEVHVNCDEPNATTDPSVIDDYAGPVYVLLGSPLTRYRVSELGK